jgi:lipopolysaccharide export system protein LptA
MRYIFLLFLTVVFDVSAVDEKKPIDITSERMEVYQDLQKTIFTGDVKVIRGAATLKAQKIDIFYGGKENIGGDIEKVVAHHNVIIVDGENTATGQKAVYIPHAENLLLSGDVVMTRGTNVLKGESLTYNLKTGNMKLNNEKGDGRVKATFTIKGKN